MKKFIVVFSDLFGYLGVVPKDCVTEKTISYSDLFLSKEEFFKNFGFHESFDDDSVIFNYLVKTYPNFEFEEYICV